MMVSAEVAISQIRSGQRIFIHGGSATPHFLIKELTNQAHRLQNVEILHIHTNGEPSYAKPEFAKSFKVRNLFVGPNMRPYMNFDCVDYIPCFLSEIGILFRKGIRKPDVALIHVSPPDKHGFCSLGTSVDIARAAVETADLVIAQANPNMPRTHGDGIIHVSQIDHLIEVKEPLYEHLARELNPVEQAIGRNVASLIPDGACLQIGVGTIPDAVLSSLTGHKNLGIHTEIWSDGALNLILKEVITNSQKSIHPGKTVSSFVVGSKKLFDYIHDNPSTVFLEAAYVNNPQIISRNKNVHAINSAVEVDLTGQVCSDSIGHNIIAGVGGQVDFIRGASLSEGGKPIIAISSRAGKGMSRIVPTLRAGAGVTTSRAHVHYVVSEYGVADLFGKSISERAQALIQIAHPDDRENLARTWRDEYTKCAKA